MFARALLFVLPGLLQVLELVANVDPMPHLARLGLLLLAWAVALAFLGLGSIDGDRP